VLYLLLLLNNPHPILESKKGVYFDGSNTTNRILNVLEEKRPKIICIDELDKMPKQFQDKLPNFMESHNTGITDPVTHPESDANYYCGRWDMAEFSDESTVVDKCSATYFTSANHLIIMIVQWKLLTELPFLSNEGVSICVFFSSPS
jgi:hypothetical protein